MFEFFLTLLVREQKEGLKEKLFDRLEHYSYYDQHLMVRVLMRVYGKKDVASYLKISPDDLQDPHPIASTREIRGVFFSYKVSSLETLYTNLHKNWLLWVAFSATGNNEYLLPIVSYLASMPEEIVDWYLEYFESHGSNTQYHIIPFRKPSDRLRDLEAFLEGDFFQQKIEKSRLHTFDILSYLLILNQMDANFSNSFGTRQKMEELFAAYPRYQKLLKRKQQDKQSVRPSKTP